MLLVTLITILFLELMIIGYVSFVQKGKKDAAIAPNKTKDMLGLVLLLFGALVFRYILAKIDPGYGTDMSCFQYWADSVYNDGFAKFYNSDTFTDYPPGYMYVLWIVGFFRNHFAGLAASTVVVKMPAMLCDLATGALIFKIARKRFSQSASIVLTSFYLFNPVILIDSAMWGQVDSVFTLFVALMIYLIAEKKLIPSYFVFAIGILMKPQTLVLTPVLLYGILDQVILKDFNWKRFFKHLGLGLLAIAMMYVLILPYHFNEYWFIYVNKCLTEGTETFLPINTEWLLNTSGGIGLKAIQTLLGVVALYFGTLTSYPYVTVNGYNFWEIFKLNWHSQDETWAGVAYSTWGTVFILLIVAATVSFCILNRKKENPHKYFFYGAFIAAGFFTLSVRVHERYMFPVFVLLLCAYLYKPMKSYIWAYMGLTFAQVCNIWHSFKFFDAANFDWEAVYPRFIGGAHFILFLFLVYIGVRYFVLEAKQPEGEFAIDTMISEDTIWKRFGVRKTEKKSRITRRDVIAMLAITMVYAVIALFNLGDMDAPQTYWETGEQAQGTCLTFDFSNSAAYPTRFGFYDGRYENRDFYLEESADQVNWTPVAVNEHNADWGEDTSIFRMESVFCWGNYSFTQTQPYLRFRLISDCAVVNEVVFFDAEANMVVPNNAQEYANLFDEPKLYPQISTFRDSTYFDEIYHGRTAYEMTLDVYNYEWTHPPLGKYIISMGVRAFGMCPFGWRIMGTLFGIGMLPILYLFAKRMFKETWIATLTTILFAADFMHFTQTRIATIDVFVTFFIILMYYFMYQYTRMNFYDAPLWKTFIPLLFSGICMGLGCACKWPGVYAGIGLAIIFFVTMFRRFMEYRKAWMHPKETTDGIANEDIISSFWKKAWKTIGFCCIAFMLIPGLIYLLSYIPFNNGTDDNLFWKMIHNQIDMWNYHSKLDAEHPFSSNWYEWIIIKRPIWYYTKSLGGTIQENISAFGNPLVWWAGIPALLYMIYRMFKYDDRKSTFLVTAYFAQLIPWMGVTRCTFIYHYFPSVPFVVLMTGYSLYNFCTFKRENKSYFKLTVSASICYVAAAVVLFAVFYPVLSGYPIDANYGLKILRWFESWVLVSG